MKREPGLPPVTSTAACLGDIVAQANRADPYPIYARLRAAGPSVLPGTSVLLVSSFAHCEVVLRSPAVSAARNERTSGGGRAGMLAAAGVDLPPSMSGAPLTMLDPPDHTRQRGRVAAAFTPRVVERLRPTIMDLIDDLIDGIAADAAAGDEIDLVSRYALPLPIAVICRMLGFPSADMEQLSRWSDALLRSIDPLLAIAGNPPDGSGAAAAVVDLHRYVERIVDSRRHDPGPDLLTALLSGPGVGTASDIDEVVRTCVVLLVSGYETVVNLVTNSALALLRHPGELDALIARPERVGRVVDEVLRFDPPVQLTVRTAREPMLLGGHEVEPGTTIVALLAAANRDPEVFDDPDRFHPDRVDRPSLSFGLGPHYCLGAALGQLESRLAVVRFAQRMLGARLSASSLTYRSRVTIRGLLDLPLHLSEVAPRSTPWPDSVGPARCERP